MKRIFIVYVHKIRRIVHWNILSWLDTIQSARTISLSIFFFMRTNNLSSHCLLWLKFIFNRLQNDARIVFCLSFFVIHSILSHIQYVIWFDTKFAWILFDFSFIITHPMSHLFLWFSHYSYQFYQLSTLFVWHSLYSVSFDFVASGKIDEKKNQAYFSENVK